MDASFVLAPAHLPRNKSRRAETARFWRPETKPLPRLASGAELAVTAPNEDSDEQLVARIAAGDERAFAAIVRRHAGRLKALALAFTGVAGEADDIVQETF